MAPAQCKNAAGILRATGAEGEHGEPASGILQVCKWPCGVRLKEFRKSMAHSLKKWFPCPKDETQGKGKVSSMDPG